MKKTKYIGGWSANNGSSYSQGYEFGNLKDAKKTMRKICEGNVFAGSTGSWTIRDLDNDIIAEGTVSR
jgi:hypothetical protein